MNVNEIIMDYLAGNRCQLLNLYPSVNRTAVEPPPPPPPTTTATKIEIINNEMKKSFIENYEWQWKLQQ